MDQTKQQALARVQADDVMQEIIASEPAVLLLLQVAALIEDNCDRWYNYEALKQLARNFVGHYATRPAIAGSQHYDAVIDAINTLLPLENMKRYATTMRLWDEENEE